MNQRLLARQAIDHHIQEAADAAAEHEQKEHDNPFLRRHAQPPGLLMITPSATSG
jgi:exoribonuclease R